MIATIHRGLHRRKNTGLMVHVAAKLLGIETVPVVRLSHLSEAERRAYVIADNKLALNAGWDREMLAIELQGLVDLDVEIELTGFSLAEVDIVLDEARAQLMVRTPRLRTRSLSIDTRVRGYAARGPLDARASQTHLRRCARSRRLCGASRR
jgi:ParB-like chromosome segregation protein Spo0J